MTPDTGSPQHIPEVSVRSLFVIAWPIMVSRMSQAVVGLCDVQMVSSLGASALAATATGSMNSFAVIIFPMAMVFLVSSFSSQLYGQGDAVGARRYGWYGLFLALLAQGVCLVATLGVPTALGWFDYSPEVRRLMADYMVVRLWSSGAAVAIEALAGYFGGLGKTRPGMIANLGLMFANVFGNWLLIEGHWGCPAMGVKGAALASTLSTWIALAGLFGYFVWTGRGLPRMQWRWIEFGRLVQFGLPAGFNWFLEIYAFIHFTNTAIAPLGTTSLAAMNVVFSLNSVSFMPAFGLASGGAILVGQAIGAGAKQLVPRVVVLTARAALLWQGATAVAYFLIPELLLYKFAEGEGGPEMLKIAIRMLMVSSAWQLFDALATTMAEALRAAGDTTFPMLARLVIAWAVFVPGALISVQYYQWGDAAATSWIVAYLGLLAAALIWRFRTGAWRKIELIQAAPPPLLQKP